MCFQGLKVNIVPMIIPDSARYNKFTKVLIRVPSRSPIHAESDSLSNWNLEMLVFEERGKP